MKYIVIFVIVLFFSVILLYVFGQIASPNIDRYLSKNNIIPKNLSHVFDNAENGDIILMSGGTPGEKTCKFCTRSIFSHVGILFWEKHPVTKEDILYIFDCDLGQGMKDGVRVMPLLDKLHRYKGMRFGALIKLQGKRPTRDDFVRLIPQYISTDFDHKIATWWFASISPLHKLVKNPKKMFCSELVASIYQDLGIVKKDRNPSFYSPRNFHKSELNFEKGYSLSDCTFFEFQKEETKKLVKETLPVSTGMLEFIGGDFSVLPGM